MSNRPFRLESVLRLRRQQLRHAEMEVMQRQAELHKWQQREQHLVDELNELSTLVINTPGLPTSQLVAHHDYRQSCYRQLVEARQQQHTAQQQLAAARAHYHAMHTELEKIQTLKDRHTGQVRRERLRHEIQQLGEIAFRERE